MTISEHCSTPSSSFSSVPAPIPDAKVDHCCTVTFAQIHGNSQVQGGSYLRTTCFTHQPSYLMATEWEKIQCRTDNHFSHLVVPGVQATEHQTKALDDPKHKVWATTSEEWKQNYQNGFNHSRKNLQGRSSSSKDVSPTDVAIHRQQFHLQRILQQTYFQQSWRRAQIIHSFSQRPGLRSMQTHKSYESAMQNNS